MVLAASKSGKMGKDHLSQWLREVYVPYTGPKSVLVHDAWSCFTLDNIRKDIPDDKNVSIMQIPPGFLSVLTTTGAGLVGSSILYDIMCNFVLPENKNSRNVVHGNASAKLANSRWLELGSLN